MALHSPLRFNIQSVLGKHLWKVKYSRKLAPRASYFPKSFDFSEKACISPPSRQSLTAEKATRPSCISLSLSVCSPWEEREWHAPINLSANKNINTFLFAYFNRWYWVWGHKCNTDRCFLQLHPFSSQHFIKCWGCTCIQGLTFLGKSWHNNRAI